MPACVPFPCLKAQGLDWLVVRPGRDVLHIPALQIHFPGSDVSNHYCI
jgi:hypothetical protein